MFFVNLLFCRYVEASEAVAEEADKPKLKTVALTCILNIAACKLKLSDWQGAIESSSEVNLMFIILLACVENGDWNYKAFFKRLLTSLSFETKQSIRLIVKLLLTSKYMAF